MIQQPDLGFYYHYKHFEQGQVKVHKVNSYAYELLNIGRDTNASDFIQGAWAVYRPLYPEAPVYKLANKQWDLRPWSEWTGLVKTLAGVQEPRFRKITDPQTIDALTKIRDEMYGPN